MRVRRRIGGQTSNGSPPARPGPLQRSRPAARGAKYSTAKRVGQRICAKGCSSRTGAPRGARRPARGPPARRFISARARRAVVLSDEGVRVEGRHLQGLQGLPWKAPHVGRDDRLGAAPDSGSDDVAVPRVRQLDVVSESFVPSHEAVVDGVAHHLTGSGEPVGGEVRAPFQDARERLVQDLVGPLCLDDPALRDPHEQIPQRGRMEDAGVVDDDKRHRLSTRARVPGLPR